MSDLLTPPAAMLERDRYGRPLVVPPGGGKPVAYTRCTTFVSALEDTYNLNRWQQRHVALGLAERPDLLLAVSNARDDKNKLNKICDDAAEAAKASSAATIGIALHGLTERLDRGEDLGVLPIEYAPDIAAYQAATAHLKMVEIERFMVLDSWKIGGTPDRIVNVDGKRRIADLKTGNITYGIGKIASQLAVYARSMLYDTSTHERTYAEVEIDWGIVCWLPAGQGRCELYRVDLHKGWRGVQLSKWVRDWRSNKFDHYAEAVDTQTLHDRVRNAATVDELYALFNDFESDWTDELTTIAAARKAQLAA